MSFSASGIKVWHCYRLRRAHSTYRLANEKERARDELAFSIAKWEPKRPFLNSDAVDAGSTVLGLASKSACSQPQVLAEGLGWLSA